MGIRRGGRGKCGNGSWRGRGEGSDSTFLSVCFHSCTIPWAISLATEETHSRARRTFPNRLSAMRIRGCDRESNPNLVGGTTWASSSDLTGFTTSFETCFGGVADVPLMCTHQADIVRQGEWRRKVYIVATHILIPTEPSTTLHITRSS
jgi:hypothetical protein